MPAVEDNLAAEWNARGRAHFKTCSDGLTAHYEHGAPFERGDDPRSAEAAQAVLDAVVALNANGQWQAARARFDPAHEPFIPILRAQGQGLSCVTAVGPDACIFRLGSEHRSGRAVHIEAGRITVLEDLLAIAPSRDHAWFVVVTRDGFHIRQDWADADTAVLPWPVKVRPLETVRISDDGRRIAFADDDLGIWMGDVPSRAWRRFHPTEADIAELKAEDPDDDWSSSMTNCDLSPDGRYLAFGTQDYGHDVHRIDEALTSELWCTICPDIDYPHAACFSDDGRYLALNGCHFYNGVTLCVDVPASRGFIKPDYESDPHTPAIDTSLRIYASTWLPPEATGQDTGAFVLAGLGTMTAVTPAGQVLFSQYFGSSASGIDYCPRTRRLFLGSYSGILHVYDIDRLADPTQTFGYRPRHEVYRWIFWRDYPPFRW